MYHFAYHVASQYVSLCVSRCVAFHCLVFYSAYISLCMLIQLGGVVNKCVYYYIIIIIRLLIRTLTVHTLITSATGSLMTGH